MCNMLDNEKYDLVIVGAGVVGLAHAYLASLARLKVAVIEANSAPIMASIRNFGFVTVTGQQRGHFYNLCMRTRNIWADIAQKHNLKVLHQGLYMAARRPEAEAVLEAFLKTEMGEKCQILKPSETNIPFTSKIKSVLYSPHEIRIESREALPFLINILKHEMGVKFFFNSPVLSVTNGKAYTNNGAIKYENAVVCPGDNLNGLYSELIASLGIKKCKLQMLRLENPGFKFKGAIMSDLGLTRYLGYSELPEAEALRKTLQEEQAEHLKEGIHLIAVQSSDGSLVVGDSHDYENPDTPFSHDYIDNLILDEYSHVIGAPPPIRERWVGTYATAPNRLYLDDTPEENVKLIIVTCGAGASSAFGIAEENLINMELL